MRMTLFVVLLASAFLSAVTSGAREDGKPEEKAKKWEEDAKKLVGKWQSIEREDKGKRFKVPDEVRPTYWVVVRGKKPGTLEQYNDDPLNTDFLTIDPTTDPKQLTMKIRDRRRNSYTDFKGIYKFDGEELLICGASIGPDRFPKTFDTTKDEVSVWRHKRVMEAKDKQ